MATNSGTEVPNPGEENYGNPYASHNKWRHQESTAFSEYASYRQGEARAGSADGNGTTSDLANFINKSSRVEPPRTSDGRPATNGRYRPIMVAAGRSEGGQPPVPAPEDGRASSADGRKIVCGPLLNYRRMERGAWHGSVLVVVEGGGERVLFEPSLILRRVGAVGQLRPSAESRAAGAADDEAGGARFPAQRLYSDPRNTFWSFDVDVPVEADEVKYDYFLPEMSFSSDHKPRVNSFFVPAEDESMRIMFHSCNGFSVGTDEDAWSGACLWNDVMRKHAVRPYHVMLGGGDQIYNDGIRVNGPLRPWTDIANPHKRREYPFNSAMRADCDDYYLRNYIRWYNTEPFSSANGQIPQVNIWDDHDIIDGFGSYNDHFMRCDVFRGIGGVAHKYYMLFQHHLPPPPSTYTSDEASAGAHTQGYDPKQQINTFVAPPRDDPMYIIGPKPGPYVAERSYNIFTRLGARMALVGLDARVERTRHQINYPETYDLVFNRLRQELGAARGTDKEVKHLIVLLGIPIAYPRLTWLENILRSPLIGPVKFMGKRFGVGGGLFNQFDGSVDLLDDLDDHYTAKIHKVERAHLVEMLQAIAAEFSARVTILGGDVHLSAIGRFYSNPKLKIPVEEDPRYVTNVVSSAIVNKPPPQAVANLLARRNKIHHLNAHTDETLLDFFDRDPGPTERTASSNHCTMPSRNFASLTENSPNNQPSLTVNANGNGNANGHVNGAGRGATSGSLSATAPNGSEVATDGDGNSNSNSRDDSFLGRDGHSFLHSGEVGSGTRHKAASQETHGFGNDGSLDVRVNVEIDQSDRDGHTMGYGMTVPLLWYKPRGGTGVSAGSGARASPVPPPSSSSAAASAPH